MCVHEPHVSRTCQVSQTLQQRRQQRFGPLCGEQTSRGHAVALFCRQYPSHWARSACGDGRCGKPSPTPIHLLVIRTYMSREQRVVAGASLGAAQYGTWSRSS